MQQNTEYMQLLQNAGVSLEVMAQHQARLFGGTAEQWQRAIATGDPSCFSQADVKRIRKVIADNPQLVQQLQQVMQHRAA